LPNTAEFYYNIVTHKSYIENNYPILFVLNKLDLQESAKRANVIEEELLREM
jgi:hypothetical protein